MVKNMFSQRIKNVNVLTKKETHNQLLVFLKRIRYIQRFQMLPPYNFECEIL